MAISTSVRETFATYVISTFILAIVLNQVSTERVSDKIYSNLQSNHYCSRRLNATHQVGCTSDLGGNFGVVWIFDSPEDFDHVLEAGLTPPYIAVLNRTYYTRKILLEFKKRLDRVSGVVFIGSDHEDSRSTMGPFSPEDVCPNRNSGLYVNDSEYDSCKRNTWQQESQISGLLYDDIPFPIFLINDKNSIDEIQSCFKANNLVAGSHHDAQMKKVQASYPLCALQLDSFMTAAQDSDSCLNSHFFIDELLQSNGRRCYPVDNHNIFAYYKKASGPLQPTNVSNLMQPKTAPPQSIVMLVAKLSSLSMFSEMSPGADSTITSIITLLAIAEALSHFRDSTQVRQSDKNIAFALQDSEPFDYTGSNRMIYNMISDTFPNGYFARPPNNESEAMLNTNLSSIEYMINLDQLANYPSGASINFHSEPRDPNTDKVDRLYDIMKKFASAVKINLVRVDPSLPLPPAPVQEFIKYSRKLKSDRKTELTGIVLSNYDKTYRNHFYHSIYDDSHNVFQESKGKLVEHLAQVSRFVALSLFEAAFGVDKSDDIRINKDLIEAMLQCYLINADCHLFTRATTAGQKLPVGPVETYKDPTKRSDDINGVVTAHLLAYFLGDKIAEYNLTKCIEENQKSLIYNFEYINEKDEPITDGTSGVCIRSQVAMLSAQSPAFSYSEEGFHIDQRYPAWTVSLNSIRNPVRLYLKPSPISQWLTFILGIVITVASFMIVYQIKESESRIGINNPNNQLATPT